MMNYMREVLHVLRLSFFNVPHNSTNYPTCKEILFIILLI